MKIPAPARRWGHTHGILCSPSLQWLTNDSPRCNDWLSSKTLAPIESVAKSAHPMQQMEKKKKKSNVLFFNTLLGRISKGPFFVRNPACLRSLTISCISVPAGQSRHACRATKANMTSMLYVGNQWDPSADLFQAQITQRVTFEGAVKPVRGVTVL